MSGENNKSISDLFDEAYIQNNNRLVKNLSERLQSSPELVALCLVCSSVQGNSVIREIRQTETDCFFYSLKGPFEGQVFNQKIDLDLIEQLVILRKTYGTLGVIPQYFDYNKRYTTIFLVTKTDGDWLIYPATSENEKDPVNNIRAALALVTKYRK